MSRVASVKSEMRTNHVILRFGANGRSGMGTTTDHTVCIAIVHGMNRMNHRSYMCIMGRYSYRYKSGIMNSKVMSGRGDKRQFAYYAV